MHSYVIFLNSSLHLVFKLVCIHPCVYTGCVLHNCIRNNVEQKEKGIFIGDENIVNCATVRLIIYIVFLFHNDCT